MSTPVIGFANQKGGVGKTTTTVNLAACLAERRQKVLLIDVDPQGNATSALGAEKIPGQSLYPVLLGDAQISDVIRSTAVKGLDLIGSELDLAGAEIDIVRMDNYLHRLRTVLAPVRDAERYDFIFLDCPPSLGILTMNALTAADSLVIPIQCEYFALEGLSVISSLVKRMHDASNPDLQIEGILMTMYDLRTNLSQQVVQEVVNHFADKVYETLIPRTVRLSEAPSFGQPITVYDKHSTGAAAYRRLAREFMQRRKQAATPEAPPAEEMPPPTIAAALAPAPVPEAAPEPIEIPQPEPAAPTTEAPEVSEPAQSEPPTPTA